LNNFLDIVNFITSPSEFISPSKLSILQYAHVLLKCVRLHYTTGTRESGLTITTAVCSWPVWGKCSRCSCGLAINCRLLWTWHESWRGTMNAIKLLMTTDSARWFQCVRK